MRSQIRLFAILLAALAGSACARAAASSEPTLEDLRRASERFRDVSVAEAEGYVTDGMCVDAQMVGLPAHLGGMGIHYVHPALLGITAMQPRVNGTSVHTDFLRPAILLYEPQADGTLELVGVENLVFRDAWQRAGNTAPPSFHGVVWEEMEDDPDTEIDEAHEFEPHYDLHIWLYRENPSGTYAPFNPAVTCGHAPPHGGH